MLEVLDPTLGPAHKRGSLALRLQDLRGKRLGVIWNGRPHGDSILRQTVDVLTHEYGAVVETFLRKSFIGNIAPPEILDEVAARCDAAITGVGD